MTARRRGGWVRRGRLREPPAEHDAIDAEPLTPGQLAELRGLAEGVRSATDGGLTIDYTRSDRRAMAEIWRTTRPILDHVVAARLPGHRPVMATFVTKYPGPESRMFLHEDRTYVLPGSRPSRTLWIPLVDCDERSGGRLATIPGSGGLTTWLSGTGTPDLLRPFDRQLQGHLRARATGAGAVLVYDSRLLHASEPRNEGFGPRTAMVCVAIPEGEQLVHVVADGRRHRRVFSVDPSFFVDVHPGEVRSWSVGRQPARELDDPPRLDRRALDRLLGAPGRARTVVPDGLTSEATPAELPVRDVPLPDLGGDLTGAVSSGPARPATTGDVAEPWRPLERWLPRGAEADGVQVVTVSAGDRVGVRASRPSVLVTLEGPAVAAGVRSPAGVAQLDLGRAPVVEGDLTLWNDGPGPLVALLAGWASPR